MTELHLLTPLPLAVATWLAWASVICHSPAPKLLVALRDAQSRSHIPCREMQGCLSSQALRRWLSPLSPRPTATNCTGLISLPSQTDSCLRILLAGILIPQNFVRVAHTWPFELSFRVHTCFKITAFLRYHSHTVQFPNFKCTVHGLLVYSGNWANASMIDFRTFSFPLSHYSPVPHPHPQQPLVSPNLRSVSIDVPILGMLCEWNHMICGLQYLASFTWHEIFRAHPYFSMCLL